MYIKRANLGQDALNREVPRTTHVNIRDRPVFDQLVNDVTHFLGNTTVKHIYTSYTTERAAGLEPTLPEWTSDVPPQHFARAA